MNLRVLLFTILVPGITCAQFLPSNTSVQQAFIQASQEDKLIFMIVESANCQQCNDVADKGLQDDQVQKSHRPVTKTGLRYRIVQHRSQQNEKRIAQYRLN